MTIQLFLSLLAFFSAISGLVTEALKKQFSISAPNLIVLYVSIVVGVVGTFIYYLATNTPIAVLDVVYAILMGVSTWLCSMLGYDKIKQTIAQLLP